ncbi:DUF2971 domain-containing protein [Paenibacillus sp. CMAA1364]
MWIEDYIKLQFPVNPDDMNIDKAVTLKHQHMPNAFFRYRSFTEYSVKNLINQQERLSYPIEFNDPFDAILKINYDKLSKDMFLQRNMEKMIITLQEAGVTFSKQQIAEIRNSSEPFYAFTKYIAQFDDNTVGREQEFATIMADFNKEQIKDMFQKFRTTFQMGYLVMCLSEKKDNNLMWSHYSANHTGFCVEYNYKELGPNNPQCTIILPCIYTDKMFDATEYIKQAIINTSGQYNNLFGLYPAITKSPEWAYEQEWRLVFPFGPGATNDKRMIYTPKPKAIYAGARASEENIQKLLEISMAKEITLYQMILSEESPVLLNKKLYEPTT